MQVDHQPSGPEMVSRRRNTASVTTDQGSNHQASLQNVQKSLSISTLPSNPNHQVQMMPNLTRKKPSQWVEYIFSIFIIVKLILIIIIVFSLLDLEILSAELQYKIEKHKIELINPQQNIKISINNLITNPTSKR